MNYNFYSIAVSLFNLLFVLPFAELIERFHIRSQERYGGEGGIAVFDCYGVTSEVEREVVINSFAGLEIEIALDMLEFIVEIG